MGNLAWKKEQLRSRLIEMQEINNLTDRLKGNDDYLLVPQNIAIRYQYLIDDSFDFLTMISMDDICLFIINQAVQTLLGFNRDELLGRNIIKFIHPDDRLRVKKSHMDAIKKGEGSEEFRCRKKNGSYIWLEAIGRFKQINGSSMGIFLACDISKRKEMEKASQLSEQRYRAVVEQQSNMIICCTDEMITTFVNRACCQFNGKESDEMIGVHLSEIISPAYSDELIAGLLKLNQDQAECRLDRFEINVDGKQLWHEWSGTAIFDGSESLLEYQIIGHDITERKHNEEALRSAISQMEFKVEQRTGELSEANVKLHAEINERKQAELRIMQQLKLEEVVASVARQLNLYGEFDIREILSIIGKSLDVNRVYLQSYIELGDKSLSYQWDNSSFQKPTEPLPEDDISRYHWFNNKLIEGQNIIVCSPEDLPSELAVEKEYLSERKTSAFLIIPIQGSNESLLGYINIQNRDYRSWLNEEIHSMEVIAETIGSYWERKVAEEKIRYLSYHDKLTGLYNRTYFEEQLKYYNTEEYFPVSVIVADLNGLKLLNDALGHNEGDEILKKIAKVLTQSCRKKDVICRWGGDEFALLLQETSESDAQYICKRIKDNCMQIQEDNMHLSIAMGVASIDIPGTSINEVLKEAEDRMYRNKLLENRSARSSFITSLENTLWARSHETKEHTDRVRILVQKMGQTIKLSPNEIEELILLAALHDIGKIAVPNNILEKTGKLSADEWEIIKKHPETGYRIALSSSDLVSIADTILFHHERWDGNGYPIGLKGREIPLLSRILALVDTFDVMVNGRPYKDPVSSVEALEEIERCSGSQFDPELAEIFINLMKEAD